MKSGSPLRGRRQGKNGSEGEESEGPLRRIRKRESEENAWTEECADTSRHGRRAGRRMRSERWEEPSQPRPVSTHSPVAPRRARPRHVTCV